MTTPKANGRAVTYTGNETPFVDRLYGSRLSFEPGQTRAVPHELAERLLRHADVFKAADQAPAAAEKPVDDTQALLEQAKLEEQAKRDEQNQRHDLVDQVNAMDKEALQTWAKDKFGEVVPKTLSLNNMRDRVIGLIDQYGVP